MADHVPCESCQAPIIFAVVHNNAGRKLKHMPLNADPDPAGNVAVRPGTMTGYVLRKGQKAVPPEVTYLPHFATCTKPEAHRRRQRKGEARATRDGGRPRRKPVPTQPTLT